MTTYKNVTLKGQYQEIFHSLFLVRKSIWAPIWTGLNGFAKFLFSQIVVGECVVYLWSRRWYSPRYSCGSAPAEAARSHCPRPAASRGPTRTPGRPSCERLNSSSSRVSMAGKSINSQPTSHLKNTEKQHLFFYFLFSKQEKLVISLFLQYSNIIIPIIVSMFF